MAWWEWVRDKVAGTLQPVDETLLAVPLGTLTLHEFWMGRDVAYASELTPAIRDDAAELVNRVNRALGVYGKTPAVNSGWRPKAVNDATAGAAKNSRHLYGQAVDLSDRDGALKRWCAANLLELELAGLWMEDPSATPTWVHWQSVPPASGWRVFMP